MELEQFNKNFENRDISIKPYLIVVSIFIGLILIIILLNNNLEDYYILNGRVIDKKIVVIVDNDGLEKITNNNKIKIGGKSTYSYKVQKISDFNNSNYLYNEVILDITSFNFENIIDNNIIEIKIVINKTTIFEYLIKTMKGVQ